MSSLQKLAGLAKLGNLQMADVDSLSDAGSLEDRAPVGTRVKIGPDTRWNTGYAGQEGVVEEICFVGAIICIGDGTSVRVAQNRVWPVSPLKQLAEIADD